MLNSIRYNLANLTNLEGRDARQTFWYYVLIVVVIQYAIAMIAAIPMYVSMFGGMFEAIANNPQDAEAGARAIEGMIDDILEQVKMQVAVATVAGLISTALLAASFVRRLHDAGFTGWIALLPIGFYIVSLIYNVVMLDQMGEMMTEAMTAGMNDPNANPFAMQAEMGLMGLFGWIAPLIGIVFGAWPSTDGPNEYGEKSVSF